MNRLKKIVLSQKIFHLRLRVYRHIGQIDSEEEIIEYIGRISSKYGSIPQELKNLFDIVSIKNSCKSILIKQLDIGPKGISITFLEGHNVGEKIMNFINKYPRHTKLKGENKLIFIQDYLQENVVKKVKSIINEFI